MSVESTAQSDVYLVGSPVVSNGGYSKGMYIGIAALQYNPMQRLLRSKSHRVQRGLIPSVFRTASLEILTLAGSCSQLHSHPTLPFR